MIAVALRGGETERGVEEHRHDVTTNGAWDGSGDPTAIDSTPMVS